MSTPHGTTLTEQDVVRLTAIVTLYSQVDEAAASSLQQKLERAVVVPSSALGATVVTMHSRVVCRDEHGGLRELEIVYPRDADASEGRVSVLAPIGRALLGAAVGERVEVASVGKTRTWEIAAIRYQPEAAGDLHL